MSALSRRLLCNARLCSRNNNAQQARASAAAIHVEPTTGTTLAPSNQINNRFSFCRLAQRSPSSPPSTRAHQWHSAIELFGQPLESCKQINKSQLGVRARRPFIRHKHATLASQAQIQVTFALPARSLARRRAAQLCAATQVSESIRSELLVPS